MVELRGRSCLVTGASGGIGFATAVGLLEQGAVVYFACRSPERARLAIDRAVAATGNQAAHFLPLDLTSLAAVRACADAFAQEQDALGLLVNNAGVAGLRGVTADGFELAFGTNHLGHFLLTALLRDHLVRSGSPRVVTLASDRHYRARGVDPARVVGPTRSLTGLQEYAVSKLCNVLFTQELSRRMAEHGLTAYSVHPGVIGTEIWRRVPGVVRRPMIRLMRTPEEGAREVLRCVLADAGREPSGSYFENGAPRAPSDSATLELAGELWARSTDWAQLDGVSTHGGVPW